MNDGSQDSHRAGYGFGTFQGVFVPSILTILGVIMYLRFGWVLGNVGLLQTLVIVTLATSITFLTGLSMSALATNRRVGGGGAYYIISRSLGVEAGAAVGVPLYFAQSLGIAFYISGFSEAVVGVFPQLDPRTVGLLTLAVLGVIATLSADLAMKTQLLILVLIVSSLVSFFSGGRLAEGAVDLPAAVPPPEPFWAVFAVFFPAVTGIEAGIAMSGDLKHPATSLPRGTLGAVLCGYVVYLAIPLYLVWAAPDMRILRTEPLIMSHVARWGPLILLGVWCASLSSALGALLGAPRTLQALARDRVVPRRIGRGYGGGNNPRIATLITFGVAAAGIAAGDLNLIAPVLSMFFLTSYGVLNLAAGLEELVQVPSWRPTFRISGYLSLAGSVGCASVMAMINPGATILATLLSAGIYYGMRRRSLRAQWGDMKYGILMLAAQNVLARLSRMRPDERNWQPNLLVFSGAPTKRWHLIELAHAFSRNRSFLTLATIVPEDAWSAERERQVRDSIHRYLDKRDVQAMVKVMPGNDSMAAVLSLIKGYGFGALQPNTILLGVTEKQENYEAYAALTRYVHRARRNLILVQESDLDEDQQLHRGDRIDLWWRGRRSNVGLMMTLAYLMQQDPGWTDARLVIRRIVDEDEDPVEVEKYLRAYVAQQRVEADVEVTMKDRPNVFEMIRYASAGADLIFLGMPPPVPDESLESYANRYKLLLQSTEGLPPTAFVLANQDIEFDRLFQEQ